MKDLFIIRVPLCIVSWSFLDAFRKKDNTHYKPVRRLPAALRRASRRRCGAPLCILRRGRYLDFIRALWYNM
jgi:hypothetical protein